MCVLLTTLKSNFLKKISLKSLMIRSNLTSGFLFKKLHFHNYIFFPFHVLKIECSIFQEDIIHLRCFCRLCLYLSGRIIPLGFLALCFFVANIELA